MGFEYSPGASAKDDVRMLIGDTDDSVNADLRLEDEEIARFLELNTSSPASPGRSGLFRSAAEAADALAAKFARKAEGSSGPNRIAPSSRAQELRATANRLRTRSNEGAGMYAGGTSVSDKAAAAADTDRVQPSFTTGQFDNPEA